MHGPREQDNSGARFEEEIDKLFFPDDEEDQEEDNEKTEQED
jgi:hypothetical protein